MGAILGVMVVGIQRAVFSNEAGVGSAAIAHSAAKTDEPVSEGIVALLEPSIDTVVICTMTALVIIIAGGQWTAQEESNSILHANYGSWENGKVKAALDDYLARKKYGEIRTFKSRQ